MTNYIHKVKYYECDRMGITHHSNYIRIMEEARIDWLEKLGLPFEKMEEAGVVSPVTAVSCNYRKPTTFADSIEVELGVEKLSTLKLELRYKMTCNGALVCTATSTHCFLKGGRPISLEAEFPELYARIAAAQE